MLSFGADSVRYDDKEAGWRTVVVWGRCVFSTAMGCEIHSASFYPSICRGFPYHQGDTQGPYEYVVDICPEFATRVDLQPLFDPQTGKLRVLSVP